MEMLDPMAIVTMAMAGRGWRHVHLAAEATRSSRMGMVIVDRSGLLSHCRTRA